MKKGKDKRKIIEVLAELCIRNNELSANSTAGNNSAVVFSKSFIVLK